MCIYSIVCSFSKETENEKKRSFVTFSPFMFALKEKERSFSFFFEKKEVYNN